MRIVPLPWGDRALVIADPAIELASSFTEEELAIANGFRLRKRREEWLLSRYALKQLPSRSYSSLSHSAPYAAAATSEEPVGIDVQVIRPLSESAAHLFLTDEEIAEMHRCTIPDRLLHFWCAKEAAFKQRSSEFTTLRQVPLRLSSSRTDGLLFDGAETVRVGDVIVALTV